MSPATNKLPPVHTLEYYFYSELEEFLETNGWDAQQLYTFKRYLWDRANGHDTAWVDIAELAEDDYYEEIAGLLVRVELPNTFNVDMTL